MQLTLPRVLAPPIFPGDEHKTRFAGLINTIVLINVAILIIFILIRVAIRSGEIFSAGNLILAGTIAILLVAWFMMRAGWVKIAGFLHLATIWLASTLIALRSGELATPDRFVSATESIILFVFGAVFFYLIISNLQNTVQHSQSGANELRVSNAQLVALRDDLELRVQERTIALEKRAIQLQTVASLARTIAASKDLDILLPEITTLVGEQFGFYHVGIFLIDDAGEHAVLQASNSEGGRRMMNRRHQLRLDSSSIVGYVTSRGESRIAQDVRFDDVYSNNPDLSETRSEMSLPLQAGGRTIGALDVQSAQPNAFAQEDISVLTTLADQVAIAIENARLFDESRHALSESQLTIEKYVKQAWDSFTQQAKQSGFIFDGKQVLPLEKGTRREQVKSAAKTGRLSLEKASDMIAVPIKLRGQLIGVLDVHSKNGQREWTRDEIAMLEAAAERAALALENARLVDSAQRRAARERIIGEISTRIGAANNFDAILQTAVEELGRKIGGAEVTLEIESDEQ